MQIVAAAEAGTCRWVAVAEAGTCRWVAVAETGTCRWVAVAEARTCRWVAVLILSLPAAIPTPGGHAARVMPPVLYLTPDNSKSVVVLCPLHPVPACAAAPPSHTLMPPPVCCACPCLLQYQPLVDTLYLYITAPLPALPLPAAVPAPGGHAA